jgi:signal transduction histidine kinase
MLNEQHAGAYLHDLRGGLQAMRNSIELLTRGARGMGDPAAVDRAAELAKRALAGHERTLSGVIDAMVLRDEAPASVDVAELLRDVLAFLQNAIAAKELVPSSAPTPRLCVMGERKKLHLCLLALMSNAIDYLPQGSPLNVSLYRDAEELFLEIPGGNLYETVSLSDGGNGLPAEIGQLELTLKVCRDIVGAHGGRLVFRSDDSGDGVLQICHPVLNH